MPEIFDHARTSARIDDPGGFLRAGYTSGEFSQRCPVPGPDNADGTDSAVPLPNDRIPPLPVILGGLATLFLVSAVLAGSAGSIPPALVLTGIALVTGGTAAVFWALRQRDRTILCAARDMGWLRYAPARVGAVWADRVVHHGPPRRGGAGTIGNTGDANHDARNEEGWSQEKRYWYRATVEVHPTDGTAPFKFTTSPFQALADRDGVPHGIRVAPGPMDAWEPEYLNGWTIARYRADMPEQSATVTTGLSRGQVSALLRTAGIR